MTIRKGLSSSRSNLGTQSFSASPARRKSDDYDQEYQDRANAQPTGFTFTTHTTQKHVMQLMRSIDSLQDKCNVLEEKNWQLQEVKAQDWWFFQVKVKQLEWQLQDLRGYNMKWYTGIQDKSVQVATLRAQKAQLGTLLLRWAKILAQVQGDDIVMQDIEDIWSVIFQLETGTPLAKAPASVLRQLMEPLYVKQMSLIPWSDFELDLPPGFNEWMPVTVDDSEIIPEWSKYRWQEAEWRKKMTQGLDQMVDRDMWNSNNFQGGNNNGQGNQLGQQQGWWGWHWFDDATQIKNALNVVEKLVNRYSDLEANVFSPTSAARTNKWLNKGSKWRSKSNSVVAASDKDGNRKSNTRRKSTQGNINRPRLSKMEHQEEQKKLNKNRDSRKSSLKSGGKKSSIKLRISKQPQSLAPDNSKTIPKPKNSTTNLIVLNADHPTHHHRETRIREEKAEHYENNLNTAQQPIYEYESYLKRYGLVPTIDTTEAAVQTVMDMSNFMKMPNEQLKYLDVDVMNKGNVLGVMRPSTQGMTRVMPESYVAMMAYKAEQHEARQNAVKQQKWDVWNFQQKQTQEGTQDFGGSPYNSPYTSPRPSSRVEEAKAKNTVTIPSPRYLAWQQNNNKAHEEDWTKSFNIQEQDLRATKQDDLGRGSTNNAGVYDTMAGSQDGTIVGSKRQNQSTNTTIVSRAPGSGSGSKNKDYESSKSSQSGSRSRHHHRAGSHNSTDSRTYDSRSRSGSSSSRTRSSRSNSRDSRSRSYGSRSSSWGWDYGASEEEYEYEYEDSNGDIQVAVGRRKKSKDPIRKHEDNYESAKGLYDTQNSFKSMHFKKLKEKIRTDANRNSRGSKSRTNNSTIRTHTQTIGTQHSQSQRQSQQPQWQSQNNQNQNQKYKSNWHATKGRDTFSDFGSSSSSYGSSEEEWEYGEEEEWTYEYEDEYLDDVVVGLGVGATPRDNDGDGSRTPPG